MAKRRTVDLLPEIFRTDTNRKFLSATLDQLTQEPALSRTQGFVGRRVGPGVNPADNYVTERTATRSNYQLEPGVVFLKTDTSQAQDAITYPGIIDSLALSGAQVRKQDRLFESEYYTWDPFCDLDKFTNYSQYYWIPQGPDSVDVGTTMVPMTDTFEVTRTNAYQFSGIAGDNPVLTLARGGTYEFAVNQGGHSFWIQAAAGADGRMPSSPNISSRTVLGVDNNGEDYGTVTFTVPQVNAQDFYYQLTDLGEVDLVTSDILFNEINNVYVDQFQAKYPDGIDGITNLDGRTIIFLNTIEDAAAGGWQVTTQFSPLSGDPLGGPIGSYDSDLFDLTVDLSKPQRYSVWRIQYVNGGDGRYYMSLQAITLVPELSKLTVSFGTQYSNTSWYKNTEGYFEQVPLLTAVLNTLYYQDGSDPAIFGVIHLVDQGASQPIYVDDIIGAKNYTAPNGVVFTNGLKVQFRGPTIPAQFQDAEFYVEGVGTGPGIGERVGFVDGEAYFGASHVYENRLMTGAMHDQTIFQQYIYETLEDSLANFGAGAPEGAPVPSTPVKGADRGSGIRLLPVERFVTPETYTKNELQPYDVFGYDSFPYDASLNAPQVPDYITINRGSLDYNAWSRSNRWFHIDVIRYSAALNGVEPVLNNEFRAKRPIIEFRANLDLFNSGTQAKPAVNIIDFTETDAFTNINGTLSYSVDGYDFIDGTRVIFAADFDPTVRDRIYEVKFIDPNLSGNFIIDLIPVPFGEALYDQMVVCLNGLTQQGLSYWYDGAAWQLAQEKTRVNQPPLFDVIDSQGHSFGNNDVYPSTTFTGSQLFGYAESGSSVVIDPVLGFGLQYLNINNVGDIVFKNYFYTDTFDYTQSGTGRTQSVSDGYARQYIDRTSYTDLIGWQVAAAPNRSRQVFRFVSTGSGPLIMDVPVVTDSVYPAIQLFVEGIFIDPSKYYYEISGNNTFVYFYTALAAGTVIEAEVISDIPSSVAYYQVPLNLENNPLNENSNVFTLGTIRIHYESIGQNLKDISGPIIGANNTRDLGDILRYGDNIVQHSAPIPLSGVFLRKKQFEISDSIRFNSQEYQKYKALLMSLTAKGDFVNLTPTQVLDAVLQQISVDRGPTFPFYWSDMIPAGETYTETQYVYAFISIPTFDTTQVYDFTSSNFKGLLVYLNGELLTLGYDYTVGDGVPTVTITRDLIVGDVIVIREYPETYGSYVPNTPTKLGMYPAFRPMMFVDETYVNPTLVIQGHDGSITVAYGDARDQVLLEFETRIFNNLKVSQSIPLVAADVVPGQFRTTDYSLAEVNQILSTDFLTWVGWNKLDYTTQNFLASSEFTWNYSQSADKLNKQPLLGAWRGIYNYFYDTTTPNTTPWEMLGFSQEPSWWAAEYGPAPYTSGNLVLWEDLEAGIVRDPTGSYVLPQYIRPGLTQVIPAGEDGELLSPLQVMVGNYDAAGFRRSWTFGDGGPTEAAWRSSSAWPFAVARLLSLTKPAEFFSLFVDRDRYRYNENLDQWLWDERYRLNAKEVNPLYGNGVSKASYINWIIDYNQQLGADAASSLETLLQNLDVRLCWRVGSYTDKKYLKIYTERSTPNSLNTGLLLPDESYALLLYQNQPFEQAVYSSVIVQNTEAGWSVYGYSTTQPYFNILVSRPNGLTQVLSAGGTSVRVAREYSSRVAQVPYGYVFTSKAAVCDFLLSYGALLTQQGFEFEGRENGYIMDWQQMANEFLYWSNQGWALGSMINLNPAATRLSVTRPMAVAESIMPARLDNLVLNQNRQVISPTEMVIDRIDNTFRITSLSASAINYVNLRFTAFEHIVILDNTSIFGDLIYQPATGARQSRVRVSGVITNDWNGTLDAPGFVLNQDNIQEWRANRKYTKGEIVLFKGEYWTASTIINPAQEFNYALWVKADYDQIQKGLLPNAANASDQLAKAYSVYNANLEGEVDLFSYGLIGFRPRQYMEDLNLDDISQVNLYQQFLGDKGTILSAEVFSNADLSKESAEYNIYEYWAIARSTYGATSNRNYIELRLNEANLQSDPALIEVIQPGQSSQADQTVLINNVWKSSYKITSPNIFPTLAAPVTDVALPTAGYVNIDDADITLFSLDDSTALNAHLSSLGVGTTIWVANSNSHDWNIYRCQRLPGEIVLVSDNYDGLSQVQFTQAHGLSVGDYLIIRFFNDAIDGVYRVRATPLLDVALIEYTFVGQKTSVTGEGVGFTLQSTRVAQPADIVNLDYAKQLTAGARVWVDANRNGQWTVLEKTDPFTLDLPLLPTDRLANSNYGSAVSQSSFTRFALVGAPNYSPSGAVYLFLKNDSDAYEQFTTVKQMDATGAAGYGNAIEIGKQTWAVVGASESNSGQGYAMILYKDPSDIAALNETQLLVPRLSGTLEFGHSVTMSNDERWVFVGAPGSNEVYAYNRVDVALQSVEYTTDGSTVAYNWADSISIIDYTADQLVVTLNNEVLTLAQYSVTPTDIVLNLAPPATEKLIITRRMSAYFTTSDIGLGNTLDITPFLATAVDIYAFTVRQGDTFLRPWVDYTFSAGTITFINPPVADFQVNSSTYFKEVAVLTDVSLAADARFGKSVATSTDGRQIIVGCPGTDDVAGQQAGRVYVYDRAVQRYWITPTTPLTFTTKFALQEEDSDAENPVTVKINNEFLYPPFYAGSVDLDNGSQFTVDSLTQVTLTVTPEVGDYVEVESVQFDLLQTITGLAPFEFSRMGQAVDLCLNNCSLYIGAPNDSSIISSAGRVEFWQNQARVFGRIFSTTDNPTLTAGDTIRVNNVYVELTGTSVAQLVDDVNAAAIPNAYAELLSNGRIMFSVLNTNAAFPADKLEVLPGTGTLFSDLGLEVFVGIEKITSPVLQDFARFGQTVVISDTATTLLVGATTGTPILSTTFDTKKTTFDANSLTFYDVINSVGESIRQAGVVYTFDLLSASAPSASNPSKFVFGQQIVTSDLHTLDQFGAAIDLTGGILLIGAPQANTETLADAGTVIQLENQNLTPAWQVIRQQKPVVDINLFNTVFMYDRISGAAKQYFDFFDPLQGRLLGPVAQNLDYIGAYDPAAYNVGTNNNYGNHWGAEHVGEIWWNVSKARFIDPNQDDEVYASRRWGQLFPGSVVEIYQWVTSSVPPAQYNGPGIPLNDTSYAVIPSLTDQGVFVDTYYFWAKDIKYVGRIAGKTLSCTAIAQYIEAPRSSGIPYIAPINSGTVAIYNGLEYVSAQDTILHVEFDRILNDTPVHVEYQLIPQDRADGFLTDTLYSKLQDSFCGVNAAGSPVPDPLLPLSEKYGVQVRPRQSMFIDRFMALKNYLGDANAIMAQYPINELRNSQLLYSHEPEPSASSGAWDARVANYEELTYQDLNAVSLGYRYLVQVDAANNGLWTIYEVVPGALLGSRTTLLIRVQNYDTRAYWDKVDWYLPGYDPLTRVLYEVPTRAALDRLTAINEGNIVKVTANAQGLWELYRRESNEWVRVGLQNGTIEFSARLWDYNIGRFGFDSEVFDAQYFDQEPVIETRKIIQAINQDILVDDLAIERNRLLILMFNYILSEQIAPTWLSKTSLIDVDHVIRNLEPFQIYRRDNQDFVLDYIKEVKPYHTQIRQFNLIYRGFDQYQGSLTDFDIPAYYDSTVGQFISPILDNNGTIKSYASVTSENPIWQTWPYSQWYQNYGLTVDSVSVVARGAGYGEAPTVTVNGDSITPAQLVARVNSAGQLIAVDVIDAGSGYTATPQIVIEGGGGTGAVAVAHMINNQVRAIKTTIKYDRYDYESAVLTWESNVEYVAGDLVRYNDVVWTPIGSSIQTVDFNPDDWTRVPAGSLNGADRTMGYYTPTVNMPGLALAQLLSGVDYPGVQVDAYEFDQTEPPLDVIYESSFTDSYLGTRVTDINVDGGAFVDAYESHAPEELVPGIVFDTLDMRVYTTPGEDKTGDGHGAQLGSYRSYLNTNYPIISFAGLLQYTTTVIVWNMTQGTNLTPGIDFQIDWVNETVTIAGGTNNDIIDVVAVGIGGGNQLLNQSYLGTQVGDTIVIPFPPSMIYEMVVWVNGVVIDTYSYAALGVNGTQITFDSVYGPTDRINLSVLGYATSGTTHSYSVPEGQLWIADGSLTVPLINSLQGTNPANIVVYRNGERARPSEGARYIADGLETVFDLPVNGGYPQELIADNDVSVYVDNIPLILGVGFTVNPWDGSSDRSVTLTVAPSAGSIVLLSVRTAAQYYVKSGQLEFRPSQGLSPQAGDIISIITWNDTSEQDILTQVFVGPQTTGSYIQQTYDSTAFDEADFPDTPGSFDFSLGIQVQVNRFDTGRVITDKNRLLVTLNGRSLFENYGFEVDGSVVVITGSLIGNADVVAITTFTNSTVPDATAFRIFQDMRGLQNAYSITLGTTTRLVQDLALTDDVIYVEDASNLSQPNLVNGVFGLITINGERIAYRDRDTINNTVSGLRRGTAGTGAATHVAGAYVYDIGAGNLINIGNMPGPDITLGSYPDLF